MCVLNIVVGFKNKLFKSSFAKNVIMITGGAAFAQGLNMIFAPFITRLYTPEEYGVLSVYIAVLGALSFIGTLNYEMGIPIVESDEKAINILVLSIITLLSLNILLLLVLFIFGSKILQALNAEVLETYLYLIPIGLLLKGTYSVFLQWGYREKNFKAITKTKFSQSLTKNITKLSFGFLRGGSIGLLIGQILGECSGILTLSYRQLIKKKHLIKNIKKKEITFLAKRYKDFPIYTTTRRYLGDITISIPAIFLTSLYGSQVVGFFGLANSIIQLPMNLIGTSISNVYYAECASLKYDNPERILTLSNKLLKKLIVIGIVPLLTLVIWGPLLFGFVFGSDWVDAGYYARLLSVSVFARFIFKPISNVFDIFEKQKFAFWINIIRIILVFIAFGTAKYFMLNSYWAVCFYSIAMALMYFIQYLGAQKILRDATVSHY